MSCTCRRSPQLGIAPLPGGLKTRFRLSLRSAQVFVVGAKSDSSGKRRIVDLNYAYPSLQEISGVQQLVDKLTFQGTISFSTYGPDTLSAEMVKQLGGLITSTLIQQVMSSGYAPTA